MFTSEKNLVLTLITYNQPSTGKTLRRLLFWVTLVAIAEFSIIDQPIGLETSTNEYGCSQKWAWSLNFSRTLLKHYYIGTPLQEILYPPL